MKENNTPLISIGIPTYNRADSYLRDALESALAQSYENIEIIVSDNCSTDNTESLVKEYKDKRIQYYKHSKNIGLKNNFNFCVEKAGGQYFLLLCDDDLIDNDFIEVCVNALNGTQDTGVVITGTRKIGNKGEILSEHPNCMQNLPYTDYFINWFTHKTALYMCSTLYNTKWLKEIDGFHSKTYYYQDVVTTAILSAKYGRIDIQDVKATFRDHSASKSKTYTIDNRVTDSLYLLDVICEHAPEKVTVLRDAGLVSFARKNYRRASTIQSIWGRWKAYMMVYKRFEYKYSLLDYLGKRLSRRSKSKVRRLRRLINI